MSRTFYSKKDFQIGTNTSLNNQLNGSLNEKKSLRSFEN